MGLFYRLLGVVDLFHDASKSVYIYHIVRTDWIIVAAHLLYSFVGQARREPGPTIARPPAWNVRATGEARRGNRLG